MIGYLLNFTLCSAVLLVAYHLLLKNKAMYSFNRVYLLAGLILSLVIPLIAINREAIPAPAAAIITPVQEQLAYNFTAITDNTNQPDTVKEVKNTAYHINFYLLLYAAVSSIILFRFAKNLYTIRASAQNNKRLDYRDAKLILIEKELTPHTFLNYIFLNSNEYHQHKIEPEILNHELAHARQRHSYDVIFIELIFALCWFNPFLLLYRKAMQLNHEFLADAAVLNDNHNVTSYQQLLFSKVSQLQSLGITSQFNYSVTKKRLIMMTKTTSSATAWLTRLAIIPVMAIALVLFCNKTNAALKNVTIPKIDLSQKPEPLKKQDSLKVKPKIISFGKYPHTKNGVSDDLLKEYQTLTDKYIDPNDKSVFKQVKFPPPVSAADRARMDAIFKQMSLEQQGVQKIAFIKNAGPLHRAVPTQAQLNTWKNKKVYGVWIDEKHIDNAKLDNHEPNEFAEYFVSNLLPAARWGLNKGHSYQVNIMTTQYYNNYVKESRKSIMLFPWDMKARGYTK
ncbi:Signal transducer regulating beta-lactamase production, contains metallopeptidase domain [Mucilaginibacter pineti]|uniref:Signal transducer regulating beta-lactamase production, contains metallopeptidase domain n=1 Tax=Mucilaginibacter pineti TaxID=1391627 RepID=A0A1G7I743_9SPHI|nr:M56 family metallopeptidase [Mucilaginibacter pineti]SDF08418.1 Signal transducer regulating beta-lactamase production, contains metallopeptidase domain [Mucilaginibacter pineti]